MTRHVVNNREVPHLWAHQSQDWAKGGGSISFEGPVLKSYWLAIGNIVKGAKGEDVALILDDHSTNTTKHKHHISMADRAVSGVMPYFRVPWNGDTNGRRDIAEDHKLNVEWFLKNAREDLAKGKRGAEHNREWRLREAQGKFGKARAYVSRFGLEAQFPELKDREPAEWNALLADYEAHWAKREARLNDPKHAAKREAAQQARIARERRHYREGTGPYAFDKHIPSWGAKGIITDEDREARNAAQAIVNADRIAAWRNHQVSSPGYRDGGALLRLTLDRKTIETSQGARFPVEDALRAFPLIARLKARGQGWERNGSQIPLGPYQLDKVLPNGNVRAGCHVVSWDEIERIARQLGLMPCPAVQAVADEEGWGMEDYTPVRLSLWTMPDHYAGEVWPAYYRSGFGQHRDSDALERSNFACALEALGGETETVIVVRESHWAVGWVEWIAIHQDDGKALKIADELNERIEDYPVVDDSHYSDLEWTEAADYWESLTPREKVQMAMAERERYHWLQKEPVWRFGRMSFCELGNDGSTIAEALSESLRS